MSLNTGSGVRIRELVSGTVLVEIVVEAVVTVVVASLTGGSGTVTTLRTRNGISSGRNASHCSIPAKAFSKEDTFKIIKNSRDSAVLIPIIYFSEKDRTRFPGARVSSLAKKAAGEI